MKERRWEQRRFFCRRDGDKKWGSKKDIMYVCVGLYNNWRSVV